MRKQWVGKRQALRTSVQLRAQMRFDSGRPPVECTITDISLTGARLTMPDAGPYPDDFDVHIPARSETKWARVRWRQDLQLGVEFLKGKRSDENSAIAAIMSRIAGLEKLAEASAPEFEGAQLERLALVEQRLAVLERERAHSNADRAATADGETAPQHEDSPAWLDAVVDQTEVLENRCNALETEFQREHEQLQTVVRTMANLAGKMEELSKRQVAKTEAQPAAAAVLVPHQEPAEAPGVFETRLRALEVAAADLRGSLQALILLISAQIARPAETTVGDDPMGQIHNEPVTPHQAALA